jgi:phosphoglycolate phosphatase-like HAD superfamily hydrolase
MPPTTDPRPLVAFDFDGTLAHDASSAWVEVEEILRSHGVDMESPKLRASLIALPATGRSSTPASLKRGATRYTARSSACT